MENKGFTLVELMVVIVIIGLLAAVATPKLSDNVNAARCSEIPKRFSKIMDKLTEEYASAGVYSAYTSDVIDENLGVNTESSNWKYHTTIQNDGEDVTIVATALRNVGDIKKDETITITNAGIKVDNTAEKAAEKKYMISYFKE